VPLNVMVVTPEREVVVADDATFVLAHGIEGDVGILPSMAPMLIALGVGPIKIEREGAEDEQILLDGGFLQVKDDRVIVLAEYAIVPDDVNSQQVAERIEELKRKIQSEMENEHAKRELARQEALHRMLRM
jgi:F-type H+-transporting ATPase subunit epsilon